MLAWALGTKPPSALGTQRVALGMLDAPVRRRSTSWGLCDSTGSAGRATPACTRTAEVCSEGEDKDGRNKQDLHQRGHVKGQVHKGHVAHPQAAGMLLQSSAALWTT